MKVNKIHHTLSLGFLHRIHHDVFDSSPTGSHSRWIFCFGSTVLKSLQIINAEEGVEKREPSCTVGGNVN